MAVTKDQILDATERRIRDGGYGGFSFRDVAADVGIKSASVHHHFPTKTDLSAAVARRYTDRLIEAVQGVPDEKRIGEWRQIFRNALRQDGRMCLCGILGAESGALPEPVVAEAKRFFQLATKTIADKDTVHQDTGLRVFAALEGAMLMARAMDDPDVFDRATASLG